jgi:hypothetical protein
MPVALSVSRYLDTAPGPTGDAGNPPRLLEAAADRSVIREDPGGPMLPPAGASRAEAIFATVAIALLVILAISFFWTLLRHRRR